MKLVTVSQMHLIEQEADGNGLSYEKMMENAGYNLSREVLRLAYAQDDEEEIQVQAEVRVPLRGQAAHSGRGIQMPDLRQRKTGRVVRSNRAPRGFLYSRQFPERGEHSCDRS